MLSETQMRDTLNGLIEDFIQRSPFFRFWKADQVNHSLSQKFLVSFDTLVKSFPALIAAGIARTTDETTRTVLAVNLYQECGEGDVTRTHHAIYHKFLATAGISLPTVNESRFAEEWRIRLFEYINETESIGAVLGALAAGEFLAQPALSRIYEVIEPHYRQADQEYFTKHLVLEEEHVKEITTIIAREAKNEDGWQEVLEGFKYGLSVWEKYFDHLTNYVTANTTSI